MIGGTREIGAFAVRRDGERVTFARRRRDALVVARALAIAAFFVVGALVPILRGFAGTIAFAVAAPFLLATTVLVGIARRARRGIVDYPHAIVIRRIAGEDGYRDGGALDVTVDGRAIEPGDVARIVVERASPTKGAERFAAVVVSRTGAFHLDAGTSRDDALVLATLLRDELGVPERDVREIGAGVVDSGCLGGIVLLGAILLDAFAMIATPLVYLARDSIDAPPGPLGHGLLVAVMALSFDQVAELVVAFVYAPAVREDARRRLGIG